MKRTLFVPFTLMLSLFFSSCHVISYAQEQTEKPASFFDLIYGDEIPIIELEFEIDSIMANKYVDEYRPAVLQRKIGKKEFETWEVEVKPRGKFRLRTCDFPPIKLKVEKDELKDRGFEKFNKMKLVTHCLDNNKDLVVREYLAYKIYNVLTDTSFRVQLIDITYRNTGKSGKIRSLGILLEDEEELGDRLESEICDECYGTPKTAFSKRNIQINALFQLLIGNTDWSVNMVRNLKLYKSENDTSAAFIVPYDFDFSGLINAPYAIANKDYDLEDPRHRIYLGEAATKDELQATIDHFNVKKSEIIQLIDDFKHLSNVSKKDMIKYIEHFYEIIEEDTFLTESIKYKE